MFNIQTLTRDSVLNNEAMFRRPHLRDLIFPNSFSFHDGFLQSQVDTHLLNPTDRYANIETETTPAIDEFQVVRIDGFYGGS